MRPRRPVVVRVVTAYHIDISLCHRYTGYEARLSAEQPSKKEFLFEVNCPGRKSYLVSIIIIIIIIIIITREDGQFFSKDSLSLCRDSTPCCCMTRLGVRTTRTFGLPASDLTLLLLILWIIIFFCPPAQSRGREN